jgi:signal transduction histidine kinase
MTSTPLTAAPAESSLPISRKWVLIFVFTICVSMFWSQVFVVRSLHDGVGADVALTTLASTLLGKMTPYTCIVIFLPVVLILSMAIAFVYALYKMANGEASRVSKRVDTERLALMELATHQLGAPLASLRWWLEIMQSPDASQMDPKDVYSEVKAAVERMDTIVQSLSNAQKVDLKELSMTLGTLSTLRHLVLDCIHTFKMDLEMKTIKVLVEVEPDMSPVRADEMKTAEVLRELLGNAISYSSANSEVSVIVSTNKMKKCAQVEVKDHGIGIPPEDQPRIFEKLFRASNAALQKPVGNGLGLYNAKGIVEQEGGEMWIKSKEHEGTSVFFTLPFAAE